MKIHEFIFLLFFASCEMKGKPSGQNETNNLVTDSVKTDSAGANQALTAQEIANRLDDTVKIVTKENFYNRNYTLSIHRFIEDKNQALALINSQKPFSPQEQQANEIILTLDGQEVFRQFINKYTFKDRLSHLPLENYYLDRIEYRGVRTKTLYFDTILRSKYTIDPNGKQPYVYISFSMDYLENIGKLNYKPVEEKK